MAETPPAVVSRDAQHHGGVRDATRAQLAVEERLVAQAEADTAPHPTFKNNHPERTGLTADQAAAVLSVLTDRRRVSVINAPAGSGKAQVMTEPRQCPAAHPEGMSGKSVEFRRRLTYGCRDWPTWR